MFQQVRPIFHYSVIAPGLRWSLVLFFSIAACGPKDAPTVDEDGDGYTRDQDCNDRDPHIHPGADDPPYDGVNSDCADQIWEFDADRDGATVDEDCDDTDASAFPGNDAKCGDGVDNDCDGVPDCSWAQGIDPANQATAWIVGGSHGDRMGDFVVAGDFDGDGVLDVAANASNAASTYLFRGPLSGALQAVDADTTVRFSDRGLWTADFDGNGVDDLLLSETRGLGSNTNRVYLLAGPINAGSVAEIDADAVIWSQEGSSAAPRDTDVGDLNGDGRDDLILTADIGPDDPTLGPGSTAIWFGPLAGALGPGTLDVDLVGETADDWVRSVAVIDWNADGIADLAIGTERHPRPDGNLSGRVWLVPGPIPGGTVSLDLAATLWFTSPNSTDSLEDDFGAHVAAVGDVGGGGRDALLVQSWGRTWLYDPPAAGTWTHIPGVSRGGLLHFRRDGVGCGVNTDSSIPNRSRILSA